MKKANIITASLFILAALGIIWHTHSTFPAGQAGVPGPGIFPIIIAVALVVMAVMIILHYVRLKEDTPIDWVKPDNLRAYLAMGAMIAYILVIPLVGFYVTSLVFLMAMIRWFSKRSYVYTGAVSVCIMGFVYAVFTLLLRVPLHFGLLM